METGPFPPPSDWHPHLVRLLRQADEGDTAQAIDLAKQALDFVTAGAVGLWFWGYAEYRPAHPDVDAWLTLRYGFDPADWPRFAPPDAPPMGPYSWRWWSTGGRAVALDLLTTFLRAHETERAWWHRHLLDRSLGTHSSHLVEHDRDFCLFLSSYRYVSWNSPYHYDWRESLTERAARLRRRHYRALLARPHPGPPPWPPPAPDAELPAPPRPPVIAGPAAGPGAGPVATLAEWVATGVIGGVAYAVFVRGSRLLWRVLRGWTGLRRRTPQDVQQACLAFLARERPGHPPVVAGRTADRPVRRKGSTGRVRGTWWECEFISADRRYTVMVVTSGRRGRPLYQGCDDEPHVPAGPERKALAAIGALPSGTPGPRRGKKRRR